MASRSVVCASFELWGFRSFFPRSMRGKSAICRIDRHCKNMVADFKKMSNIVVHVMEQKGLAAYAVPYSPVISSDESTDFLQREIEILRTKNHWRKAYFYLWDELLNLEHYEVVRDMAMEIRSYAPDARIMTTLLW